MYSTVECPEAWPVVLARIGTAIGAKSGLVRRLGLQRQPAVFASHHWNLAPDLQSAYCEGLVAEDPYLDELARQPPGQVVTNDGLIDLRRIRRTSFYRDYMKPLDNHYIVGGFIERDRDGQHTIIGFHRHSGARQFDRPEQELVQQLAPHIRQAMRLGRLLARESQRADSAERALDAMAVASLLLDREARLLHANRTGEALLNDGGSLRTCNGGRVTAGPRQAATVRTLIEQALAGPAPASALLPRRGQEGEHHLLVVAMPARCADDTLRDAWPETAVILYAGNLDDTGMLRPDVLQAIYGLTPAEARLAVALGRGGELPVLAEAWAISNETLRKQLKAVFVKTGVNRQVELVRLLAGAPWRFLADEASTGDGVPRAMGPDGDD